jgi:allantoin racemase
LILGCTLEFGFFQEIQQQMGVPVVDAVFSSFKMAEYLAGLKKQMGWKTSRKWSMTAPPEEELTRFGIFDAPPPIGNKIEIR